MAKKDKKKKAKDIPQEVKESAHRVWLAGLGALARAEEEGSRFFRQLVERGEELEGQGKDKASTAMDEARGTMESARGKMQEVGREVRERGKQMAQDVGKLVDERVDRMLHRLGVPSRDEIERLTQRVEELNHRIEGMGAAPAAKPAPKPKPAAKAKPAPKAKPAAKPKPAAKRRQAQAEAQAEGEARGQAGGQAGQRQAGGQQARQRQARQRRQRRRLGRQDRRLTPRTSTAGAGQHAGAGARTHRDADQEVGHDRTARDAAPDVQRTSHRPRHGWRRTGGCGLRARRPARPRGRDRGHRLQPPPHLCRHQLRRLRRCVSGQRRAGRGHGARHHLDDAGQSAQPLPSRDLLLALRPRAVAPLQQRAAAAARSAAQLRGAPRRPHPGRVADAPQPGAAGGRVRQRAACAATSRT